MTKRLLSLLLALLPLALFAEVTSIAPEPVYPEIARRVTRQLGLYHLSGERFDDRLSAIAWTNLVDSLDFDHTLLTQEDLAEIEPKKTQIDDMIARGDLSFGYDLMQLVRERLLERCDFVETILKEPEPFDFTGDDVYVWKRRKAERPANRDEQRTLWRTALKNEYLALTLAKQLDAEEAEMDDAEAEEEPDYMD